MARRQQFFTATAGRDKTKRFQITEMPADQAERWALRALFAVANAGTKLPDGALEAGMAGVAASVGSIVVMGLRSLQGLSYGAVGELLEEMMGCVKYAPPGVPAQELFSGENSQIEEVQTRLQLKWEVLQVHTDFSVADALSSFRTPPAAEPAAPSA